MRLFSLTLAWQIPSFLLSIKLIELQSNGGSQQLTLLYGLLYILDPISPIQWEFLISIAQIVALYIAT